MKKKLLNELSQIKYMFDYKRGVVISEQASTKTSKLSEYAKCVQKFGEPVNTLVGKRYIFGIDGKNEFNNYIFLTKSRVYQPDGKLIWYLCDGDKIILSDVSLEKNKLSYPKCVQKFGEVEDIGGIAKINGSGAYSGYSFYNNNRVSDGKQTKYYYCKGSEIVISDTPPPANKSVNSTSTQKPKVTYTIPKELVNREGVKAFQTWLDSTDDKWYYNKGILGDNPKKGWGNYGQYTDAAWKKYKKQYLDYLNKNTGQKTTTSTATTQTNSTEQQYYDWRKSQEMAQKYGQTPNDLSKQFPAAAAAVNQPEMTGEEIYNNLNSRGLIKNRTLGGYLVDDRKNEINKEQFDKLVQYFNSFGSQLKKQRENGMLVFTKAKRPSK